MAIAGATASMASLARGASPFTEFNGLAAAPYFRPSMSISARPVLALTIKASPLPFTLRVRAAAQKQKRENVETPNISTPPLPVESSPPEATNEEEDEPGTAIEGLESGAQAEESRQVSPDEIGQEIKALRVSRGEVSTSSQDFWGGVWEETKLVEWPQFQKVLGTTGVVVGIIFGSAILLLTVNAVLAELSDQVFNGSSEFARSWTRGGL